MELNHPEDRDETDLSCVAAIMPELPKETDDGKLIAKVHVIDTPMGKIANTLARYGYKLGISSRGNGDVDYRGQVVEDTYQLQCWDLVAMPAVKDARLSLVTESLHKPSLTESLNKIVEQSSDDDKKVIMEKLAQLNITLTSENTDEAREVSIPVEVETSDNGDITVSQLEKPIIAGSDKFNELTDTYPEITITSEVMDDAREQMEINAEDVEAEVADSHVDNGVSDDAIDVGIETSEKADDVGDPLIKDLQESLKERNELVKANEELQSALSVGYAKEQQLTTELNRCKSKIQELVESTKVVVGLRARSNKLEENVNQLSESLKDSQQSNTKLTKTVNVQSASIRQLERLKEHHDQERVNTARKLSESTNTIKRLQDELQKQRKLFENKLSETKKSAQDEYSNKLEKVSNENKSLINENEMLKTKLDKLSEAYAHSVCDAYDVDYDLVADTAKNGTPSEVKKLAESLARRRVVENRLPFTNNSVKKINYIRPADNMTERRYRNSDDIGIDEVEQFKHYER